MNGVEFGLFLLVLVPTVVFSAKAKERLFRLMNRLGSPDPDRSESVACMAGGIEPDLTSAAGPVAEALLTHRDHRVRAGAAATLGQTRSAVVVMPLMGVLRDRHPHVRRAAAWALGRVGPAASKAAPHLAWLLRPNEDRLVALEAAHALRKMGPGAASALPALVKALYRHDLNVGIAALAALGNCGVQAGPSVPAVLWFLKRSMMVARSGARLRSAPRNRANHGARSATRAARPTRRAAPLSPATCSPPAFSAAPFSAPPFSTVPAFREAVGCAVVRRMLVEALGRIGAPASGARPNIRQLLGDPDPGVRAAARRALNTVV